jgi:hypothetical protein
LGEFGYNNPNAACGSLDQSFFFFFPSRAEAKKRSVYLGFLNQTFFDMKFYTVAKKLEFFSQKFNDFFFLEKPKIKQSKHLFKLPDFYAWFKLLTKKINKDQFRVLIFAHVQVFNDLVFA